MKFMLKFKANSLQPTFTQQHLAGVMRHFKISVHSKLGLNDFTKLICPRDEMEFNLAI